MEDNIVCGGDFNWLDKGDPVTNPCSDGEFVFKSTHPSNKNYPYTGSRKKFQYKSGAPFGLGFFEPLELPLAKHRNCRTWPSYC